MKHKNITLENFFFVLGHTLHKRFLKTEMTSIESLRQKINYLEYHKKTIGFSRGNEYDRFSS
jgi:hypothetical protein